MIRLALIQAVWFGIISTSLSGFFLTTVGAAPTDSDFKQLMKKCDKLSNIVEEQQRDLKDHATEISALERNVIKLEILFEQMNQKCNEKCKVVKGQKGQRGRRGYPGKIGVKGNSGVNGSQGPTGQKGAKGDLGPTGATGSKGQKGANGDIGPTGATGLKGQNGTKGDIGPTGPTGSKGQKGAKGDIGPTGPIGATGSKGQKGAKGDLGPIGATGSKGQKGAKGDLGPIGATGSKGQKGVKGDLGPIGATGSKGQKGAKGDLGPIGATGSKGQKGAKGDLGPIGATGSKGQKGAKGDLGPIGATGSKGQKGAKGDLGPIGATGQKGQKGQKGEKGNFADSCQWTDWSPWSVGNCSKPCGGGTRLETRTRTHCLFGTATETRTKSCNTQLICPKKCVLSTWGAWGASGPCDESCTLQPARRTRTLGKCPGSQSETKLVRCNSLDYRYGKFGAAQTDDEVKQLIERVDKLEILVEQLSCKWTDWSTWSIGRCSSSCDGGTRLDRRTRKYTHCVSGTVTETRTVECNTHIICKENCLVWSTWGAWGASGPCDGYCTLQPAHRIRIPVKCPGSQSETKFVRCNSLDYRYGKCERIRFPDDRHR
ncbi:unnamed protein product [Owenia fusiformis]|uniref:Uncharacterized protein n=1 Tax=Owenia fusiformis TaxID=6347 RepID=A0A8S4PX39_OWEFU|nr:unnamed protein product [Owenia fusiformis]